MAYYIKVTPQVCKKLGHGVDRNDTADSNKLLWQADIDRVQGDTIFDRARTVGGVALTPVEAKNETDGVEFPQEVFTPEDYQDEPVQEVLPEEEAPQTETPQEEKPLEEKPLDEKPIEGEVTTNEKEVKA